MSQLQDAINTAYNEAEKLHSVLEYRTDEEIIDTREDLKQLAYIVMWELTAYAEGAMEEEE